MNPQAIYKLALQYEAKMDYGNALRLIEKLIIFIPENISLLEKRATYLIYLEDFDRSIEAFKTLYHLNPTNPCYASNASIGLSRKLNYDQAVSLCKRSLSLSPDYGFAYNNMGGALKERGDIKDAQSSYFRGTVVLPQNALFQWNLSIVSLMLGDFELGWTLYESGFHCGERTPRFSDSPQWKGTQSLVGKTLLIHSEQGFGDSIQMLRYLLEPELAKTKVILEIEPSLFPLLQDLRPGLILIQKNTRPPEYDFHCPMMSLPLAFRTSLNTIPHQTPYLSTNKKKYSHWKSKLGLASRFRIGIAWSGNPFHKNDYQRSIPLAHLESLFLVNAEFHAIQKDIRVEDLHLAAVIPNLKLHSDELEDFSDTAALVEAMDLIITVDTSVAHLAGALARPTFLLISYVPDFRWLLFREDTPWYPSFALFRQTSVGDWSTVISRILVALRNKLPAAVSIK
jgi:tetratricopeptide (TPR) repeat protein